MSASVHYCPQPGKAESGRLEALLPRYRFAKVLREDGEMFKGKSVSLTIS